MIFKKIICFSFLFFLFAISSVNAIKILVFEPLGFFDFLYKNTFPIRKTYTLNDCKIFERQEGGQSKHVLDILSIYQSFNEESFEIDVLYKEESQYYLNQLNKGRLQNYNDSLKEFLKEKKYDIISCSFSPCDDKDLSFFETITDTLMETNTLFLILAGNYNKPISLLSESLLSREGAKHIIFVGSCDGEGRRESYSNYPTMLSSPHFVYTRGNGFRNEEIEGTSFATPRLGSYAAKFKIKNPNLSAVDLKNKLISEAILTDFEDFTLGRGYILSLTL